MEQVSEDMSTGSMSNFEYLLISAIIQYSYPDVKDWTDVDLIDPDFIAQNFDAIRNITNIVGMQLPLYKRSVQEIEKALKHYQYQFDVFLQIAYLASNVTLLTEVSYYSYLSWLFKSW